MQENKLHHFSYSSKRDITTCPHRYELLHIKKIAQSFEPTRFLVANTVDSVLTDWARAEFPKDWITKAGETTFKRLALSSKPKWKNVFEERDKKLVAVEACYKLEKAMREHGLCRPDAITQVNRKVVVGNVRMAARFDIMYTESNDIYDLKTTTSRRWLDVLQLVWYHMIQSVHIKHRAGKVGFLAPLISEPVQSFEVTPEMWSETVSHINKAVGHIETNDFPATGERDKDCYMCLVKHACKKINRPLDLTMTKTGFSVRL